MRVCAAGVRPKTGCVIFAKRALLHQQLAVGDDKDRNRHMPQTAFMRGELFDRLQGAVDPGGDHDLHQMRLTVVFISPSAQKKFTGSYRGISP